MTQIKKTLQQINPLQRSVFVWLIYSLIVCVSFWQPWYLRGMDYFFPPWGGLEWFGANWFIITVITTINKGIVPPQILEKIIIFCAFFVPFLGGALLLKNTKSLWAMVFAGVAMTCNPYFYNRFVDGQLGMYLLFCTIPFWLYFLYQFFSATKRSLYHYIIPVILSVFTASISMHGAWFLLVSFIVFAIIFLDRTRIKRFITQSCILAWLIGIANLYRVIPNIIDSNSFGSNIQNFSLDDLEIFKNYTVTDNNYLTTLSLQWYRWEWNPRFMLKSYGTTLPPFAMFSLMFLLVVYGIYYCLSTQTNDRKKLARSILIMMGISYILWLGTAWENLFADSYRWLYEHIPFFQSMRESNKRLLLLAVGYAYFGWYAIYSIGKYIQSRYIWHTYTATILGILILIGYTPSIFRLHTQIPVVDYPADRYTLREELLDQSTTYDTQSCSPMCYDILILPRHQYIGLSFTRKIVLNPARTFFYPLHVLQWDNIEIWGIYRQTNNPATQLITDYLAMFGIISYNSIDNTINPPYETFIAALKNMGIKHIVLLKGADYHTYEPLLTSLRDEQFLEQVKDTAQFIHYVILAH